MTPTKETTLSSPDPLGMSNSSIFGHTPTKKTRQPLITPRKALREASGNPQVQEFYIDTPPNLTRNASPKKSPRQMRQSTSPWRIRLTVQAEPIDEMQKPDDSSKKRLAERTTTTTVPLKGGDDTPPAVEKKGRGRPRKSLDGPVKRSGTPKPKVRGRRRTLSESPSKQKVDADSEMTTPPKKPRGRPKKSVEPKDVESSWGLSQKNDLDVWLGSSLVGGQDTAEMRSKTTRTRSRGRRQEITPIKAAVDSDTESGSSSAGIKGETPKELAWTLGNRQDGRDQIDQQWYRSHEALKPQKEESLMSELSREQSALETNDLHGVGSVVHTNTRSPSPHRDDAQDPTDFDPTAQLQEYDSILESEGFSMVSVSSIPSMGSDPVSPRQDYGSLHEHTPTFISSPSVPLAPEFAKVPSSPRQLEIPTGGTPRLAKVVRAGIALQGVLNPNDRSQRLGSPFRESQKPSPTLAAKPEPQGEIVRRVANDRSPEDPSADLFRGFGAGTRRELKAGLRLGEELAKRQQRTSQEPVVDSKEWDDTFHPTNSPNYPQIPTSNSKEGHSPKPLGSEKPIRYPLLSNEQLPSPERSLMDEEENWMSWKADTPIKQEAPAFTSAQILVSDDSIGPNASAIDYTMMAREEEWQREREAVSKQIEMANKSQVIIIDSDGEGKEEEQDQGEYFANTDIWQSEAQCADHSRQTTPEASIVSLQPEVLKPRRSKIPSPWRSNSQVVYSDEVEPTESNLFWQSDQSQARVSKRQNAEKVHPQDLSNISAESILDTSLENTRKAEAQIQMEALEAWPVEHSLFIKDEDSTIATSAERTTHEGSQHHADRATRSPVVVVSGEHHNMPESPPTPNEASLKDVTDVSEQIAALEVTEGISTVSISRTSKSSKAVIDPRLFQKVIPSNVSNKPARPVPPIQFLQPTQSSTTWLSRLTAPIWSVLAPAAPLPPPATKEDILCSSPHEPLCQLTPWEECHFRALGPLYYGSLLYGAHLFPFNPRSPTARYCGAYVTTKLGWSRKITPEDCGVTDAFMVLLDERGYALGEPGARWIDEAMVLTMCVALWIGMIKRGEIEADRSKGERIGLRDQGDRKWTKDDIDWSGNQTEYFERKRREFDGLPSWKNKA